MGKGTNPITRSVRPGTMFPDARHLVDSSITYSQGDLMCLLSSLLDLPASEGDGASFLGTAKQSVTLGQILSAYLGTDVDDAQAIPQITGPEFGVVAKCVSKTGDAWAKTGYAYLDPATGTRGVSSSGTKAIGIYQGDTVASASAGQEIEVLLGHRWPGDSLQF